MKREHIKSLIKSHYAMIRKLEDMLEDEPIKEINGSCSVETIIESVNNIFNTDCREQTRRHRVVLARHCAAYFMRKYTDLTLEEISMQFSNTDHSSAHHSIKTCQNLMDTDDEYKIKVDKVKQSLQIHMN